VARRKEEFELDVVKSGSKGSNFNDATLGPSPIAFKTKSAFLDMYDPTSWVSLFQIQPNCLFRSLTTNHHNFEEFFIISERS
jgi:hypothetical protein